MSKRKVILGAAIAAMGLILSSHSASAQYDEAYHGAAHYGDATSFGYPLTSGCDSCAGAGNFSSRTGIKDRIASSEMAHHWRATKALNHKVYARNQAWPKPFACASRQHYHNIWISMYDAGWEEQCVLTATHFDQEGELTRYGKQQIAGMMMNMPKNRRVIFVQETANPTETKTRMAKVQNVIDTWFGQRGGMVQLSSRTPQTQSGDKTINIFRQAAASAPAPVITIQDSSTTVGGAIGGSLGGGN